MGLRKHAGSRVHRATKPTVVVVVGTRPEAIKMAPVAAALERRPRELRVLVCGTGQHAGMLDQAAAAVGLRIDHDLAAMRPRQTVSDVSGRILAAFGRFLEARRPAIVLVQGDTASTLACALAAFWARVPVGHVEAGLRTHDPQRPFPEEVNRAAVAQVASIHFAPTERAVVNLLAEGVGRSAIHRVGNTVIDSLVRARDILDSDSDLRRRCEARFRFLPSDAPLVFVTGHRRESLEGALGRALSGVARVARLRREVRILFPVHRNPEVRRLAARAFRSAPPDRVHLVDPVSYVECIHLLRRATVVVSDSGGIQEEAPYLGREVVVMREVTERPEILEAGAGTLVGTDSEAVTREVLGALRRAETRGPSERPLYAYGDGRSGERIAQLVARYLARVGS